MDKMVYDAQDGSQNVTSVAIITHPSLQEILSKFDNFFSYLTNRQWRVKI